MQWVRLILGIAAIASLTLAEPARAQQYCNVPCVHRAHPYDLAPCSHPCYSPWGPVPCHPAGDAYPCVHPLHPWDVIPC